jgi:hypothetical protein
MLGSMPRLLRDLIGAAIGDAPDMSLVDGDGVGVDETPPFDLSNADVLIVGVRDDGTTELFEPLLYAQPHMTLLAIGFNGRSATLYELRPHKVALGDVLPGGLIDAIRASARAKAK